MTDSRDAALQGLAARLLDNVLGIPNALNETGNKAQGYINNKLVGALGPDIGNMLVGPIEPEDGNINVPSGLEVLAGADAIAGVLGGDLPNFDARLENRQRIAKESPIADGLGAFGGDVATILTGRLPIKKGTGGLFDDGVERALASLSAKAGNKAGDVGVYKQIQDVLDSQILRDTARGFGRSLETGLEGAVLAAVQDGDPIETGGIAAGGQLLASGGLTLASGTSQIPFKLGLLDSKNVGRIGQLTIGAMSQSAIIATMLQVADFSPDEAEGASYDKLRTGLILGMAAVVGKRPKSDGLVSNFPRVADAILTVPRTAMIKGAQAAAEDPSAAKTISLMADGQLNKSQLEAIQSGIDKHDLSGAVRKLSEEDEEFKLMTDSRYEVLEVLE